MSNCKISSITRISQYILTRPKNYNKEELNPTSSLVMGKENRNTTFFR